MRAKRLAKIIELAEILHEPVEHECLRPLMAPTQKEELKGDKSLASPQTHNSGYLKILHSQYLKSIKDEMSRTYATIAAYNTGAGNVARAFDGTTRIANAVRLINSLPPDEILRRLTVQLPYEETRRYVTAVVARQERYRGFDAGESKQMLAALH